MPPTLPIDLANFPALRTRKALLILDLQNEFLSPGGSLHVASPDGFVDRILSVAKAFRESGSGDVFWIRSQFDAPRPTANAQIITSSSPQLSSATAGSQGSSRGRRRGSEPPNEDQDADPEAFLSIGSAAPQEKQKQQQQRSQALLPGSYGSELAPSVATTVNARQDLVIAKSHYSAFESTQLLMRLRTRFVTELYICGALTNISIYATALDAARHGLTLTIIEDCCGYRNVMRHTNALGGLVRLTGCDTLLAEDVLESLASQSSDEKPAGNDFAAAIAAITAASNGPPRVRRSTKQAATGPLAVGSGGSSGIVSATGPSGDLPVRTKVPEPKDEKQSDARSVPSPSEISALSRSSPTAKTIPETEPKATQSLQSVVATGSAATTSNTTTAVAATATAKPIRGRSPASIPPLEIDPGEITPDEADGQDDDDDSLCLPPMLPPSRHEKLLEYARLRSQRNTSDIKKHLQGAAKASAAASAAPRQGQQQRVRKTQSSSSSPTTDTRGGGTIVAPKAMAPSTAAKTKPDLVSSPGSAKSENRAKVSPQPEDDATSISKPDASKLSEEGAEQQKTESKANADADADADADSPLVPVDTTKEPAATEPICAGDTIIYHNVLPHSLEDGIYERLRDEVQWLRMSHQGGEVPRLVCVQGDVDGEGNIPIYRHPADESPPLEPFTRTVLQIKGEVEKIIGHPLNHVLIQLYRSGNDYISEHSDKTLDIVPGSYVCNMSLGAERTMIFRTKRADKDPSLKAESSSEDGSKSQESPEGDRQKEPSTDSKKRQSCRVQLPHNSLCRMGLQTNMKWLHAIRQDKRQDRDKTPAELAFGGGRISLTFRQIGTFLDRDQTLVWGQGAVGKTRDAARPVVNGQSDEAIHMLRAFGTENHSSTFDWKAHYGDGFDVLHMSSSPRFFASADPIVNMTVQLLLAELGITYAKGSLSASVDKKDEPSPASDSTVIAASSLELPVRFVDNDRDRSTVQGVLGILLYLDAVYGPLAKRETAQRHLETAHKYTRLQQALLLQDKWRGVAKTISETDASAPGAPPSLKALKGELAGWDSHVSSKDEAGPERLFIAGGSTASLADFAFWPVLYSMEQTLGSQDALESELKRQGAGDLARYYTNFKARESVERICATGDK